MQTRDWKLNIVATVIDGRLFCPIDSVYEFFGWVTGHKGIMTHHLPDYCDRLTAKIAEHCNIDKARLKADIDELVAHLEISPDPDFAAVQFRNFMCNQKNYHRNVPVAKNCCSGDHQPGLLDGLPPEKPLVVVTPDQLT